jgi:hypothetical protein
MNIIIESLGWLALALIIAVMLCAALCVRRSPVDREAGVDTGYGSRLAPAPTDHFIRICARCHTVTEARGHEIHRGHTLRVSHGLCNPCWKKDMAKAKAELDASGYPRNPQLATV